MMMAVMLLLLLLLLLPPPSIVVRGEAGHHDVMMVPPLLFVRFDWCGVECQRVRRRHPSYRNHPPTSGHQGAQPGGGCC
jgi:hypothetical protein